MDLTDPNGGKAGAVTSPGRKVICDVGPLAAYKELVGRLAEAETQVSARQTSSPGRSRQARRR